jgi:hypothetical protein
MLTLFPDIPLFKYYNIIPGTGQGKDTRLELLGPALHPGHYFRSPRNDARHRALSPAQVRAEGAEVQTPLDLAIWGFEYHPSLGRRRGSAPGKARGFASLLPARPGGRRLRSSEPRPSPCRSPGLRASSPRPPCLSGSRQAACKLGLQGQAAWSLGAAECGLYFGTALSPPREGGLWTCHPKKLSHVGPQPASSLPGLLDGLCPLSHILRSPSPPRSFSKCP